MKNQFEVFSATISNFDTAIEATNTAINSNGSAMKENEKQADSFKAKLTALKSQFEELVLGEGGLSKFIKLIINAGTAILKFANSDIGQFIIKTTLLLTTVGILNNTIGRTIKDFMALASGQQIAIKSTFAMNLANKAMNFSLAETNELLIQSVKAWAMSPFGMATIAIGAVFGLVKIVDHFTESVSEAEKSLDKINEEYKSANSTIKNATEELKDLSDKIDELNSKDSLTLAEEEELETLKEQTEELERQVKLEEYKRDMAQQKATEKAGKVVHAFVETEYTESGEFIEKDRAQVLTENAKRIKELTNANEGLQRSQDLLTDSNRIGSEAFKNNEKAIADNEEQIEALKNESKDLVDSISSAIESANEESEAYKTGSKAVNSFLEAIGELDKAEENTEESAQAQTEALMAQAEADEELAKERQEQTEAVNKAYEDAIDSVSGLDDAYRTLSGAVDEYNSTGMLSLDTLDNLLSMDTDYLSLLDFENGQLSLNEEGLYALANARIDQAETTAIQKAQNDLLIASNYGLADSEATAGNTANASVSGFDNASVAIADLAQEAINGRISIENLFTALGQSTEGITYYDPNITKGLINELNVLEGLRANIGKAVKATKGSTRANRDNTKARKDNSDATKAQTQALKAQKKALEDEAKVLEKQIDDYETVIDYIKDLLQEEKEALEDERDAEIKINQDKIDDLEYNNEKYEKEVEHKLHLLELEKEEQEDYWDAQIDEMKQANNTLEENIKLQQLQEALARAKTQKVKVLKGGQFVYAQDEEAISKAEQELADYEMELSVSRQIAKLEELKKEALDNIDKQRKALEEDRYNKKRIYEQEVEDLEEANKDIKEKYDAKIEQYETYEKDFQKMLNRNARKHAKTLANELLGEQTNWDARMKALSKFVSDYDAKKQQLNTIKTEIGNLDDAIRGAESSARSAMNNARNYATQASNYADNAGLHVERAQKSMLGWKVTGIFASGAGQAETASKTMTLDQAISRYSQWATQLKDDGTKMYSQVTYGRYARGSYSLDDDKIALVADPQNPSNREMVVGSKLNMGQGVTGKFQKGTGIIPHGQNLTESLVRLGVWANGGGLQRAINNNSNSEINNHFHIENINLPSVKNGEDFVKYLENNFMNDAIQYSNIRGV